MGEAGGAERGSLAPPPGEHNTHVEAKYPFFYSDPHSSARPPPLACPFFFLSLAKKTPAPLFSGRLLRDPHKRHREGVRWRAPEPLGAQNLNPGTVFESAAGWVGAGGGREGGGWCRALARTAAPLVRPARLPGDRPPNYLFPHFFPFPTGTTGGRRGLTHR